MKILRYNTLSFLGKFWHNLYSKGFCNDQSLDKETNFDTKECLIQSLLPLENIKEKLGFLLVFMKRFNCLFPNSLSVPLSERHNGCMHALVGSRTLKA